MVTVSFVLSVCMAHQGSHWMDFHEIWYVSILYKSVEKIQVSLKSDTNSGYFTRTSINTYDNMTEYLLKWEMFQTNIVVKIKTFLYSVELIFPKNCAFYEITWKNMVVLDSHRSPYNVALALYILDNKATNTFRMYNTYCFSVAPKVMQMRLIVTLYVHCLSC
jgi:hypothetical protein